VRKDRKLNLASHFEFVVDSVELLGQLARASRRRIWLRTRA